MREIRFRGKRLDNGEWLYGNLIVSATGKTYIIPNDVVSVNFAHIEVDPKTVGQYTGMIDQNGKEIYEGDVLMHPKGVRGEIKYVPKHAAFLAYWEHDGKCGYDYLDVGILKKCEIIGNIYDNPELLKGEETA